MGERHKRVLALISSNNRQYAKFLIARETTTKIFISISNSCNTNKGIPKAGAIRGKENRSLENLFHLYMKLPHTLAHTLIQNPWMLRRKLFDFLLIIEMSLFIDSISCEKKKDFFILLTRSNTCSQQKKIVFFSFMEIIMTFL